MTRTSPILATALAAATLGASAQAAVVPFTEDFVDGPADWRDQAGASLLDWTASGGPDGSAFASSTIDLSNASAGDTPVFARAQDEFGSSGGAFEGNWIADGVSNFSFSVRHDAAAPLSLFARFSGPANFPGAIGVAFAPVLPGVWTEVNIPIFPESPNLISFEGSDFNSVFSNIGHVQLGLTVDEASAGLPSVTLDIDKVSIVPAPGAAMLAGLVGLAGLRRRRA